MRRLFLFFFLLFYIAFHLQGRVIRKPKTFRILVGGDVMFDWGLREVMQKKGFFAPVEKLLPLFEEVDFRMVNLETPVASSNIHIDKTKAYVFNAKQEELKVLNYLYVDLVFLANNHSMDYGKKGLQETLENLQKSKINFIGAGNNLEEAKRPYVLKSEHGNFYLYSRSAIGESRLFANDKKPGAAFFYPKELVEIASTKKNEDIYIASLHWGVEYNPEPTSTQINQAYALIDAGFKIVVGHHPHIPQGIEKYKDGIIVYSLGNFIFGSRNPYITHNILTIFHFQESKLLQCEVIPVFGKFQKSEHIIYPLTGKEAEEFLLEISVLSEKLGTKLEIENGKGYIKLEN